MFKGFVSIALVGFCLIVSGRGLFAEEYPIVFVHGFGTTIQDEETWASAIEHLNHVEGYSYYSSSLNDKVFEKTMLPRCSSKTLFRMGYYRSSQDEEFRGCYGFIGGIGADCVYVGTRKRYERYPTEKNEWVSRESYVVRLSNIVDKILASTGSDRVTIVAYSDGGLIAKAYIQWFGGNKKVHKLLMVSTNQDGFDSHLISILQFFSPVLALKPHTYRLPLQFDGELEELRDSPLFQKKTTGELKSYSNWLNHGWVELCRRSGIEYATIAGDKDWVIHHTQADMEGAVFNRVVHADHLSIGDSLETIGIIKDWVFH